jgi:hypothetical protein
VNLEWVQIIAGIKKPVLQDTQPLQHIEGEWFKSIREFLHKTNSTAEIDNIWTPKLHDKCIMDVLQECHDTAQINRVRIYLQASTIADITNAEGTHIRKYHLGAETQEQQKIRGARHTIFPVNQDQDQNHGRHGQTRSNRYSVPMEKADNYNNVLANGSYPNNSPDRNGTGITPLKQKD